MLRAIKLWLCRGVYVLLLTVSWPLHAQSCEEWPLWQAFFSHFIQDDGRVLADESSQRYSTSEGQAYALFFSLVANDRALFDRLLQWTTDNMAGGDLGAMLPAWQWGKREDGKWDVADRNSAADADLWFAYTLLEAGRLWHEPRYTAQGKLLLANIRIQLIRNFPGEGEMLIPAPAGFELEMGGARLNPSYIPVQLLRVFIKSDPSGPWMHVLENNIKLLKAASEKGFIPDWVAYMPGKGYLADPKQGSVGSYDAIRVYLWWGMLHRQDAASEKLKKILSGMNQFIPNKAVSPPLMIDAKTGVGSGISPPSFSAALLPYFKKMGNKAALKLQQERLLVHQDTSSTILAGGEARYYDQVLALFGQGWVEKRFSFSLPGLLVINRKSSCSAIK